jgi:adenosyl cobinamide kinase/adenosyl cobinamide phosphate guanylyltransferase
MFTFLIGGARSGKSALALQFARAGTAPVTFIATAQARDAEMSDRISVHRSQRPPAWSTVEAPLDLDRALRDEPEGTTVVIDCLTLWVANLIEAGDDDGVVARAAEDVARRAGDRAGHVVVVSNEVGSGLVPMEALSRRYRDLLGRVNTTFCDHAGQALLVVAGRVVPLLPLPVPLPVVPAPSMSQ